MTTAHPPPTPSPATPLDTAHPSATDRRGLGRATRFTRRKAATVRTHPAMDSDSALAAARREDLWDRHGSSIYAFAFALLGDESAAAQAVRSGLMDLTAATATSDQQDDHRSWAHHVYARSQELASAQPASAQPSDAFEAVEAPSSSTSWFPSVAQIQRASVALCLLGGHTYREVALLLDVSPMTVADLLTTGLRDAERWSAGGNAANA